MNSLDDEFDIWKIKTEDPMASMNESEKEHYIK
jgi:hypothetical protein